MKAGFGLSSGPHRHHTDQKNSTHLNETSIELIVDEQRPPGRHLSRLPLLLR